MMDAFSRCLPSISGMQQIAQSFKLIYPASCKAQLGETIITTTNKVLYAEVGASPFQHRLTGSLLHKASWVRNGSSVIYHRTRYACNSLQHMTTLPSPI